MNLYEEVLAALKEKKGNWVSGESLSNSLKVSRTAIWKQIKTLQAEGYLIDSSSKKGYLLKASADILSRSEVWPELETQVLGQTHYIYYPEIDSTNIQARELASQGYPEGTVVIAEMQNAGRGRRGRTWFSPANKGIYASVILRPALPLRELSRISLVAATAVADALQSGFNINALIKWPNDILVNNKKIAGILSEAITDMDGIEYVVVGFGLNINNDVSEFPSDLRMPATSVQAEQRYPCSRIKVLQGLLYNLEQLYKQLLSGNFDVILKKARDLSLVIGQDVRLETDKGFIIGKAIDINADGFLLVLDQNGVLQTVMSGEIDLATSPTP